VPPATATGRPLAYESFDLHQVIEIVSGVEADEVLDGFLPALGMQAVVRME
jgi:hypothetical protein